MRVKYFCWNKCSSDIYLEDKFKEEDGYIILLELIDKINSYARELDAIVDVIEFFEKLKKETDWYTSKSTLQVRWFLCRYKKVSTEELTFTQAKNLYRDTKIKYETLYELFITASKIHYKECPEELINKYFSEHHLNI